MPGRPKKEWYVAIGQTGGEYAGNPLSFEASQVYGPYTEAQADELVSLVDEFPNETRGAVYVRVSKKPFRELKKMIREELEKQRQLAKEDDSE